MDTHGRARDAAERREIIERLLALWDAHPNLRLTQLIGNVFPKDPYYVEDLNLVGMMEHFYAERGNTDGAHGMWR